MRKYLILVLFLAVNFIFAQTTFYVSLSGSNSPPYGSLANGANDIQTAVDAASNGDLILVNDGTYVLPSQITITKGVTVRSINGKSYVTIDGDNSVRCVYMNHADAVLDGFAITNGYNPSGFGGAVNIASGGTVQNCVITNSHARDGGGVAIDNNGLVYNCVIANNTADNGSTGFGGGVRMLNGGITRNSLIHSNTSRTYGGGINIWNAGTIQSCTVTNNTAPQGAGVRGRNASTMENSIVYFNNGGEDVQLSGGGQVFNNNCTTNLLLNNYGTNNIVDDPVFGFNPPMMNPFRIASNSPCVDAGINQAWMTGAVDYDGYDRIFNGTVDIGAFEYFLSALDVPELVSPGDPF
ncbi:MAG: hypothetical protein K9H48_19015 [Melioribacteraceae bacterium]|nr:hypothetical protein [Melioribacteraceae bacterium]